MPPGVVAVVDGQNITVSDLETTMNIARLSLKTSYPEPGTEDWVTLRARALESLAHDAELRAWARNLGVTVKPSAVDAAVKSTLASAFPGKHGGQHRPGQGRRGVQEHGHDARAVAAAAPRRSCWPRPRPTRSAVSPNVTDAQVKAQYEKDKSTTYALPERRKLRHILVKDKALADQLYAQLSSSDASFAELAKKYSTDSSKTSGGELGVMNRNGLVKPFADVAFTLRAGRRLDSRRRRSSAGT